MNIAIVDDEPGEAEALSGLIREYAATASMEVALRFFMSGEELLRDYHPYAYTAIFMDIYMDQMTGVEAARRIRAMDNGAVIVFLTSSDEHMPEAFSIHAYDYIGKPAVRERIFKVMDDILMQMSDRADVPRLSVRTATGEIRLALSDIVAVRTSKPNYLDITEAGGREHHARMTFSEVSESLLADNRFLLIMRGVIVNMAFITRLDHGSCELEGGLQLAVNLRKENDLLSGTPSTPWTSWRITGI